MMLFAVALDAPVVGVLNRWPNRLHAVEMGEVVSGWKRGTFVTACGVKGTRLYAHDVDGTTIAAPWPPRLKGMPARLVRCQECYVATGKPRPRIEWVSKPAKEKVA